MDPVRLGCKMPPQKDRQAASARSFLHQIIISSRVEPKRLYICQKEKNYFRQFISLLCQLILKIKPSRKTLMLVSYLKTGILNIRVILADAVS